MHQRISKIEREVDDIRVDNQIIRKQIDFLVAKAEHVQEHFSAQDIIRSFLGSLFFGFGIILSGGLLNVARNLPTAHLFILFIGSILILTANIYFVGYSRIKDKKDRGFGQFWFKRILVFYAVAIFVSAMMTYIFGIHYLDSDPHVVYNVIMITSIPCAVGASFVDLIKKY